MAVLYGVAAAALMAWWRSHALSMPQLEPAQWLLAAGLGLVAAAMAWAWQRPAQGLLMWDGAGWCLQPAGAPTQGGHLLAVMDLGGWLLLRFQPLDDSPQRWFGVSRADAGAAWHGLRAAVYCPAHDTAPAVRSAEVDPPE